MSIAQDFRTRAKHRGLTPWQLIQKIGRLEREADNRTCLMVEMATHIDELTAQRNQLEDQLDIASIDLSTALDDLRIARQETARTQDALTATEAKLANATAVSDLPQLTATQPIPIAQRFDTGPAIRLGKSPLATTDPGRVPPTWARTDDEDTQPLPAA
ncbi:hypothetical protein [Streptomyces sp. RB13]|uniref:hypothetical protein n=1 Tax=Streptomyces sp. RB13 TaxID=2950978 RepID=UPI002FC785C0|nr:hypothetical protein OHA15_33550 [Streptomyces anthocyanicus]